MNFENYGYKEEKLKVRTMSMAELKIGLFQMLIKRNCRYANIRLINTTLGDVDSFVSVEDFLMSELYSECYEIELLSVTETDVYEGECQSTTKRIVVLIRETRKE